MAAKILPLGIVAAVLCLPLLFPTEIRETLRAIAMVDTGTVVVVLLLSLVNYALRCWRWLLLLGERSAAVPPLRHCAIYMAGFALTATPGKAGEAMRSLYLQPFGVSPRQSLAALYAERLLDLVVISMLAALVLTNAGAGAYMIAFAGLLVVMALTALQHPVVIGRLDRMALSLRQPRAAALLGTARDFLGAVRSMLNTRLAVIGTVLGLVAWGGEGVGTYLIAQSLGLEIGLALAIGIYAVAMLAGAFSFLPGGLGGAEVAMTTLLVYAGASVPVAIAVTMIVRLATLWFAVAIGLGAWFGLEVFRGPKQPGSVGVAQGESSHAST
ncbi:lysylphosphatidylglycerol synthase transmembrane domain-containing protein [Roseibium salinum]|nr:lysylphosphatidylglycerol synthase transmembrane domain-containing protein [Roseibium salinum]